MTYFQQLKDKYPKDVQKAYTEYVLSKTIYRTFYCSENAPNFVKEAMDIQSKFNVYAEQIVEGKSPDLLEILNVKKEDFVEYYGDKENIFDFLEIDRSSIISHVSNMYEMKLRSSIPQNLNWETLESIIKEEKNNTPVLKEKDAVALLKNIADTYGLNSVTYGKVRTTEEAIKKLDSSLEQLQEVVECESKQIGLGKYNLFLDVNEFSYAGQAMKSEDQIKLYLNERLSHDAFAHEWLHGMDMLMSEAKKSDYYMYSQSSKGKVHQLLKKLNEHYEDDIKNIKQTVIEDTRKYSDKIVDRFDAMSSINNPKELKETLQSCIDEIVKGNFKTEIIIEKVNKHMKDKNGCSSYVLTELSMLNSFMTNKDKEFKNSYFYEYAKEMDKSLSKTGLMDDQYSTLKEEMFARAFESFTQVKLKEKGLPNDIAHANISAWTPNPIETIRQKAVWEDVLSEMKEVMEIYSPSQKKTVSKSEKEEVKSKIGKIRKTHMHKEEMSESHIAVKIK